MSPPQFDSIATVVDWLDACRDRRIDDLMGLYGRSATLECACENATLAGREALEAYWRPKLVDPAAMAFQLDAVYPHDDGVSLDYQSHQGQSLRIHFRFDEAGKIIHTRCSPLASSAC